MTSDTHPAAPARVAAIFDDGGGDVSQQLAVFSVNQRSAGRSVLGVVMQYRDQGPGRKRAMILIDIDSGTEYPVSQALGKGSDACQLDLADSPTPAPCCAMRCDVHPISSSATGSAASRLPVVTSQTSCLP